MSVEAEKGPEPWLLKAATFTTFRPFSRPFNLKMASVAKGSSMLKTFEWVPLPQLTKICKEKDSIYQMGCAFFSSRTLAMTKFKRLLGENEPKKV